MTAAVPAIISAASGVASAIAAWATFISNSNPPGDSKQIILGIANYTRHPFWDPKIRLIEGQITQPIPKRIESGQAATFPITNVPGSRGNVKGIITYVTDVPDSQGNTHNKYCTMCIYFENPYSSRTGSTRYNVQPDYYVNNALAMGESWLLSGPRPATNNYEEYATWSENQGSTHYWVYACMTNSNPSYLEINIRGHRDENNDIS